MKVYVLEQRWDYEAGNICSIHKTYKGAAKALYEIAAEWEGNTLIGSEEDETLEVELNAGQIVINEFELEE